MLFPVRGAEMQRRGQVREVREGRKNDKPEVSSVFCPHTRVEKSTMLKTNYTYEIPLIQAHFSDELI